MYLHILLWHALAVREEGIDAKGPSGGRRFREVHTLKSAPILLLSRTKADASALGFMFLLRLELRRSRRYGHAFFGD